MKRVLLVLLLVLVIPLIYYLLTTPDLSVASGENVFVDTFKQIAISISRIGESIAQIISKAIPRF